MTIETATSPEDLNTDWPEDPDLLREGAGHIRLVKLIMKLMRGVSITNVSAARTFSLADANRVFRHPATDTTARIWTIPANASVAFPVGTVLMFRNELGAGAITIAITTDTLSHAPTGNTGQRIVAAGGWAWAMKEDSAKWFIVGVGLS